MIRRISTILVVFSGIALPVCAQDLPKDVLADQYLITAKKHMDAGRHELAVEYLEKMRQLNIPLPDEYYYYYGRELIGAKRYDEGQSHIKKYVARAGRNGKFYQQALELLSSAEEGSDEEQRKEDEKARQKCKILIDEYNKLVRAYQEATETAHRDTIARHQNWSEPDFDRQHSSTVNGLSSREREVERGCGWYLEEQREESRRGPR